MIQQPHIKIEEKHGHVVLVVADTELCDFVEDFLSEQHDLDYAYCEHDETNGKTTHTLYFPGIEREDLVKLERAIAAIDPLEIQRIWELNN